MTADAETQPKLVATKTARRKVEDHPLPLPEAAGGDAKISEEAAAAATPFRIFVSYVVGKDKYHAQILNTPFEDIDSVDCYAAVLDALTRMHGGKRVSPIFFKALEA